VHVLVPGKRQGRRRGRRQADGVEKVLLADGAAYEHQPRRAAAALIVSLAGRLHAMVLAPGTAMGKNILPRVAALLDVMQVSATSPRS
jgi:electron transfer flavoprotein alpha subunit